jgi:hypothetical protein
MTERESTGEDENHGNADDSIDMLLQEGVSRQVEFHCFGCGEITVSGEEGSSIVIHAVGWCGDCAEERNRDRYEKGSTSE